MNFLRDLLQHTPTHTLKAVELANHIRDEFGASILSYIREEYCGLLNLLEGYPQFFTVQRIPKNDMISLAGIAYSGTARSGWENRYQSGKHGNGSKHGRDPAMATARGNHVAESLQEEPKNGNTVNNNIIDKNDKDDKNDNDEYEYEYYDDEYYDDDDDDDYNNKVMGDASGVVGQGTMNEKMTTTTRRDGREAKSHKLRIPDATVPNKSPRKQGR